VLDVIEGEKLLERSNATGARVRTRLETIRASNSSLPIVSIRGLGSMIAFDIVKERGSEAPMPTRPEESLSAPPSLD
jgi:4-aminobutyrate aminotransferase/(S)-3-amino-2-methylpropionate transaminase